MPRRQQRRAWGHISESVKGRKYVLRWVENTPEGRKRPCETFYGTYREACARLDEIHVMHGDSKPTMTFGQVYRTWYEPILDRRIEDGKTKAGTVKRYKECWAKTVAPKFRDIPVTEVKPAAVQDWLLTLSKGNANVSIVILRKLGDLCVNYELCDSNKFRIPYEMPAATTRSKSRDIYTFSQAVETWGKVKGSCIETAFVLACFGGVRTGESLAVRSDEVSRVESCGIKFARVPIVRRMGDTGHEPYADGDLKTRQSMRTVFVPYPFGKVLVGSGKEWLCGGICPMNKTTLKDVWEGTVKEGRIPFSNLRNSWRTFAQYEWGVDYDTLEVLMGHALPGVTGAHYLAPDEGQLLKKMAVPLSENGALSQS